MEMKGYCFECGAIENCETFEEPVTETIKGMTIRFNMTYCRCKKCGELASSSELEDKNHIAATDAYKKQAGLLTSSEIREIRRKQGLSAMDFAKKLKLGAKTITRYENGGIQTPQIDQLIRNDSIMEDRVVFLLESKLRKTLWIMLSNDAIEELKAETNGWSKPKKIKESGDGKWTFAHI